MNKDANLPTFLSTDKEFRDAVAITRQLKDKGILKIQISIPYLWGIDVRFDDAVESFLSDKGLEPKSYRQVFKNEISEMILCQITSTQKSWTRSKINEFAKTNQSATEAHEDEIRSTLQARLEMVGDQLIDKTLLDTFALRKVTKNHILTNIDWDINTKVFSPSLVDHKLPPYVTIEFRFAKSLINLPVEFSRILEAAGFSAKGSDHVLIDVNLQDVNRIILELEKMRAKLLEVAQFEE